MCTNTCQPNLETLIRISDLLKVDVNDRVNASNFLPFNR